MGITRRSARQKGSKGEAEVLIALQNVLAEVYRERNLPPPELYRGANGRDIRGISWLAPEVKRHEPTMGHVAITRAQISGWWEQAKSQAGEGQVPCLFYRQNFHPWRVVMMGYVELEAGARLRTSVEISFEAFMTWFRERSKQALAGIKPVG